MSMSGNHRERTVPHDHGRRLFDLLTGYPTVRICRDILTQYVFERPMLINGTSPKNNDVQKKELEDDWRKLKFDIFDHAMALGFVAVRVDPERCRPWCRGSATEPPSRSTNNSEPLCARTQ